MPPLRCVLQTSTATNGNGCCESFQASEEPDHCPLCDAASQWLVEVEPDGAEATQ